MFQLLNHSFMHHLSYELIFLNELAVFAVTSALTIDYLLLWAILFLGDFVVGAEFGQHEQLVVLEVFQDLRVMDGVDQLLDVIGNLSKGHQRDLDEVDQLLLLISEAMPFCIQFFYFP